MRKKLTIEHIIIFAISIITLLLFIAFYAYYKNHKKLQKLQRLIEETELKVNLDQFTRHTEKLNFPDARAVFRPGVVSLHPINGLKFSVMEYLFFTFSAHAFANEETEMDASLKNLLHIKKEYRIFYAQQKRGLALISIIFCTIIACWGCLFYWVLEKKQMKYQTKEATLMIGPPGFFYPIPKVGSILYFKGKAPIKIAKRHYTNLLLDIKEVGRKKDFLTKGYLRRFRSPE
jgi:hypothetical protein